MWLNKTIGVFILFILLVSFQKDKPAYTLFTNGGKIAKFDKMIADLADADIILFGEYHDNPIAHWLQLEVTKSLHANNSIMLAAEMFEADNQDELDEYLSNDTLKISEIDSMRLWPNYRTDYAPLVDFAKSNKLQFIASNVPRRYANSVYRGGFQALDTVSELEKTWIAPLPIKYDPELPGYQEMLAMMGGHGGLNLPKAQALKDATMAYFILKNRGDKLLIHYNGSFHSNNFDGIYWHLKNANPNLKIKTIATVSQEKLSRLESENKKLADYIIAVSATMTSTH
jgi:uncharacterized iron-regulated protein